MGIVFAVAAAQAQPGPEFTQAPVWVAVAMSASSGNYGASTPQSSSAGASQMALKYCAMYGAKDCKVIDSYWNDCIALATTLKPIATACCWGSSPLNRAQAATIALNACNTYGAGCAVRVSPCYTDDPRWASPLPLPTAGFQPGSVDRDLVGYWKANVSGGMWILQIAANGTYTFHSAAPTSPGNQPMHNGTFTTSNGKYTVHAINVAFDTQGTYTIEGSSKGTLQMNGTSGSSTWYRTGLDPDP
ncbi:MAG: DUF4189 domain-containing protein [Terracidiphilus sp.]